MADRAGAAASVENRDEALFKTSLNLPENQRLKKQLDKQHRRSELKRKERLESFRSEKDELSVELKFKEPELQSLQESVGELQKDVRRKEDEREERESVGELQKDVRRKEDEREEREFTFGVTLRQIIWKTHKSSIADFSSPVARRRVEYGPSRSTKGPYVEPLNCTKIGDVSLPNQTDAEQAAMDYCSENPAQNCCTIKGGVVTKWSLPSRFDKVELKRADHGVYFLCHIDLDVEW